MVGEIFAFGHIIKSRCFDSTRGISKRRLIYLNKDLQFKEGLDEFFRGNSRIILDCRVCSILKILFGCRPGIQTQCNLVFNVAVVVYVLKIPLSPVSQILYFHCLSDYLSS